MTVDPHFSKRHTHISKTSCLPLLHLGPTLSACLAGGMSRGRTAHICPGQINICLRVDEAAGVIQQADCAQLIPMETGKHSTAA